MSLVGNVGRSWLREPSNQDIVKYLQKIDANISYLMQSQHKIITMVESMWVHFGKQPQKIHLVDNPNSQIIDISPQIENIEPQPDIQNYQLESRRSINAEEFNDQPSQMEDLFFMHLNEVTRQFNPDYNHYSHQDPQAPIRNTTEQTYDLGLDVSRSDIILRTFQEHFNKMNLKFTQCEIVYTFPDNSSIKPMEQILDRQNLMILMKLSSGQIVGAFTEVPFSSKDVLIPRDNPKCFLANLSHKRFLYASKTNKTHSVDRNYLMFGNWEIKIKIGDRILDSDVGKKGGCFMRESFGGSEVQCNTRQWLFGQQSLNQKFQLQKYVICIFR